MFLMGQGSHTKKSTFFLQKHYQILLLFTKRGEVHVSLIALQVTSMWRLSPCSYSYPGVKSYCRPLCKLNLNILNKRKYQNGPICYFDCEKIYTGLYQKKELKKKLHIIFVLVEISTGYYKELFWQQICIFCQNLFLAINTCATESLKCY